MLKVVDMSWVVRKFSEMQTAMRLEIHRKRQLMKKDTIIWQCYTPCAPLKLNITNNTERVRCSDASQSRYDLIIFDYSFMNMVWKIKGFKKNSTLMPTRFSWFWNVIRRLFYLFIHMCSYNFVVCMPCSQYSFPIINTFSLKQ